MVGFILTAVVMTITVGAFMAMMFTSGMKDDWKRVVVSIILAIAIGCGIAGMFALEQKGDEIVWNNGTCECGGEWDLVNVEHIKNGGNRYYWNCEDCGHVIETHRSFK